MNDDGLEDPHTIEREFKAALHRCGWAADRAWRTSSNHTALVAALHAAIRDGWEPDHLARRVAFGLATYPADNAAAVLLNRLRRAAGHTNDEEEGN